MRSAAVLGRRLRAAMASSSGKRAESKQDAKEPSRAHAMQEIEPQSPAESRWMDLSRWSGTS